MKWGFFCQKKGPHFCFSPITNGFSKPSGYLCVIHQKGAIIKKFDIPAYYRSSLTGRIKALRQEADPRKKDRQPALLDLGPVRFMIPRHFGFCYGVENAIEISYKALEENPDKRVFLLSQMIHNQEVNRDLVDRGIQFIMDTDGTQFIPFSDITPEDIVIIPAFGTTLEIEKLLQDKGIETKQYNTTCPFVEKVWKRSTKLGNENYTVIIHGKYGHEETRATFSHSTNSAPSVIVRDLEEARLLGDVILGKRSSSEFYTLFENKYSPGFDPEKDFERVGVVNQTTMLASETQAIADYFKQVMEEKYSSGEHFADTRDTLCYATNDNQDATIALLDEEADVAFVIGGYNSSNTSHIAELCEGAFPTYFINGAHEIKSANEVHHYDHARHEMKVSSDWLPDQKPVTVILTSGASCPDTIVDQVLERILSFFPDADDPEKILDGMG